jgi:hypothetical protein
MGGGGSGPVLSNVEKTFEQQSEMRQKEFFFFSPHRGNGGWGGFIYTEHKGEMEEFVCVGGRKWICFSIATLEYFWYFTHFKEITQWENLQTV